MNKYLKTFVEEFNLETRGNVQYGTIDNYQGYVFIDIYGAPAYQGGIFAHIGDNKAKVTEFLTSKKKELKLFRFEVFENAVLFAITGFTFKGVMETYRKVFAEITQFFTQIGVLDAEYCPICGDKMEEKVLSSINDVPVYLDAKCAAEKNAIIEKRDEEFKNAPNNYIKGTLGAILGGLIGAVVWVAVAYFTGYISGLIALLIAILASVGYDLLKGKPTKVKLVIVISTTIILSVVSMLMCYVILASINNTTLSNILAIQKYKGDFISDMIFAAVFGGLGSFMAFAFIKKKIRN